MRKYLSCDTESSAFNFKKKTKLTYVRVPSGDPHAETRVKIDKSAHHKVDGEHAQVGRRKEVRPEQWIGGVHQNHGEQKSELEEGSQDALARLGLVN